jgi:virginiamycin B lyase
MRATVCLVLLLTASGAGAAEGPTLEVQVREWPVPWEGTRPRDPCVGPDGRVWFVGQEGDYLAFLEPASGRFEKLDLEPGTGPHNLIVDETGAVWFTGNRKGYIGRLDPATGEIARYPMPDPKAEDPHTLAFDPSGDVWFTVQFSNFVGKLETRTGAVRLIGLPNEGSRPYGIVVDGKGRPWFNEFGTDAIGTVDPATLELEEVGLPDPGARSRRIALGKDGGVWFVDYARGFLGRLDPATRRVREWPMPGGSQSLPYAMAADDRGRLWAVETGPQPNRILAFDPKVERFVAKAEIPSGGGTVRNMVFAPKARQIWFGTDKGTIGRVAVP